jgi:hypothetical protein
MQRVGAWFNRQPTTLWTLEEAETYLRLQPDPGELDLLESWYLAPDVGARDIRRRDLGTLLQKWTTDLDRARLWRVENP